MIEGRPKARATPPLGNDVIGPSFTPRDDGGKMPLPGDRKSFTTGERVDIIWSEDKQRYPGKILHVLKNDTYEVLFDDGVKTRRKSYHLFRLDEEPVPVEDEPIPVPVTNLEELKGETNTVSVKKENVTSCDEVSEEVIHLPRPPPPLIKAATTIIKQEQCSSMEPSVGRPRTSFSRRFLKSPPKKLPKLSSKPEPVQNGVNGGTLHLESNKIKKLGNVPPPPKLVRAPAPRTETPPTRLTLPAPRNDNDEGEPPAKRLRKPTTRFSCEEGYYDSFSKPLKNGNSIISSPATTKLQPLPPPKLLPSPVIPTPPKTDSEMPIRRRKSVTSTALTVMPPPPPPITSPLQVDGNEVPAKRLRKPSARFSGDEGYVPLSIFNSKPSSPKVDPGALSLAPPSPSSDSPTTLIKRKPGRPFKNKLPISPLAALSSPKLPSSSTPSSSSNNSKVVPTIVTPISKVVPVTPIATATPAAIANTTASKINIANSTGCDKQSRKALPALIPIKKNGEISLLKESLVPPPRRPILALPQLPSLPYRSGRPHKPRQLLLNRLTKKKLKRIIASVRNRKFKRKRITASLKFKDVRVDIINCICGRTDEFGLMVQCEVCLCWQHGNCFGYFLDKEVPRFYVCQSCNSPKCPRPSLKTEAARMEIYKKGYLPNSFASEPGPSVRKQLILKKCSDLSRTVASIESSIFKTRLLHQVATAIPEHRKLYQWSAPRQHPKDLVEKLNFRRYYSPILRRLLLRNKGNREYLTNLGETVTEREKLKKFSSALEDARTGIKRKIGSRGLILLENMAEIDRKFEKVRIAKEMMDEELDGIPDTLKEHFVSNKLKKWGRKVKGNAEDIFQQDLFQETPISRLLAKEEEIEKILENFENENVKEPKKPSTPLQLTLNDDLAEEINNFNLQQLDDFVDTPEKISKTQENGTEEHSEIKKRLEFKDSKNSEKAMTESPAMNMENEVSEDDPKIEPAALLDDNLSSDNWFECRRKAGTARNAEDAIKLTLENPKASFISERRLSDVSNSSELSTASTVIVDEDEGLIKDLYPVFRNLLFQKASLIAEGKRAERAGRNKSNYNAINKLWIRRYQKLRTASSYLETLMREYEEALLPYASHFISRFTEEEDKEGEKKKWIQETIRCYQGVRKCLKMIFNDAQQEGEQGFYTSLDKLKKAFDIVLTKKDIMARRKESDITAATESVPCNQHQEGSLSQGSQGLEFQAQGLESQLMVQDEVPQGQEPPPIPQLQIQDQEEVHLSPEDFELLEKNLGGELDLMAMSFGGGASVSGDLLLNFADPSLFQEEVPQATSDKNKYTIPPPPPMNAPSLARLTPEMCQGYIWDDVRAHQQVIDKHLDKLETELMELQRRRGRGILQDDTKEFELLLANMEILRENSNVLCALSQSTVLMEDR